MSINRRHMKKQFSTNFLFIILLLTVVSCDKNETSNPEPEIEFADPGLYVGLIGFNDQLSGFNPSLVSHANSSAFYDVIDGFETAEGALLYHAVNEALINFQNTDLPDNPENITLITFTDGIDESSYVLNDSYDSGEAYLEGLQQALSNTKINGEALDAYAIGFGNSDVSNMSLFNKTLDKLSTQEAFNFLLDDLSMLDSILSSVGAGIYNDISSQNITLSIKAPEPGTKIRFTFDDISEAENSMIFIEGEFAVSNNTYKLSNLNFSNLSSDNSEALNGELNGTQVSFTINNIKDAINQNIVSNTYLKQWIYDTNKGWVLNNDFSASAQFASQVAQKSAAIIFVMDCSSSLQSDFEYVQQSYKSLVASLLGEKYVIDDPDTGSYDYALIRFEKEGAANYITQLAVSSYVNGQWDEELATYNFEGGSGLSDYFSIPEGQHAAEYYETHPDFEEGWYFCFQDDPYFSFENGSKYTLYCYEADEISFELLYDGPIGGNKSLKMQKEPLQSKKFLRQEIQLSNSIR